MKQHNRVLSDLFDFGMPEHAGDLLWRACKPTAAEAKNGIVYLKVPFEAQTILEGFKRNVPNVDIPQQHRTFTISAYGEEVVRVSLARNGEPPSDHSMMLEYHDTLRQEPLTVEVTADGWSLTDTRGEERMRIVNQEPPIRQWSDLIPPPPELFRVTVLPDGHTEVPFMAQDSFQPSMNDSFPLAYVERDGRISRTTFALHAEQHEKFAGTGERFAKMDLSGRTFTLENEDALGVNNRRAYKNIPFYVSSKPYGLFIHSSAHIRLSLADISTRAAQAMIEDDGLDLFFIGGGGMERILYNYRRITGFPHQLPPLWSFGTWMSRMSYWTAEETLEVARRMREEEFPCDVIHLDTGWFDEDWKCDWSFSKEKYPDPEGYMRQMRDNGFRISLWQNHSIGKDNKHFEEALSRGYIAPMKPAASDGSNFSTLQYAGTIDFSNPSAVDWYQGLLEKLLQIGASVIKTDFGEEINMDAVYHGLPGGLLHNLYSLLYQKAAYDITQRTTGEGIIWARSGWAGSQRYPIHWGGDCGCTWDGLAGTIRGGLHIGLSGFAFWSHDVPGFHGVPNFMNSMPPDDLYVRWTQVGVFTSHLRYHGAQAREPYEYPSIAPLVRKWLRLRYALIPYLVDESGKALTSGMPVFRSLVFHHGNDPVCWTIDDQYYFGDALMIAPVLNAEGVRNIYLPEGEWIDFWTGETVAGGTWLKGVISPLDRIPVFAVKGSAIRGYPDHVQCTDEMDLERSVRLSFDDSYQGFSGSILGECTGL